MDYPQYKFVKLTPPKDGVVIIELNNPPANVFSDEMIAEITDLFGKLNTDPDVKVGRFSSTANIYCAGAELKWMKAMIEVSQNENAASALRMARMFEAMKNFHRDKALINVVQGAAMGGGVGFASIGYTIAEANGKIEKAGRPTIITGARGACTEIRLGIVPGVIAWHVKRAVGVVNSYNLFFTGQEFDAELGKKVGIFKEVHPKENVMARADELVKVVLVQGKAGLPPVKEPAPVEELWKAEDAATILKDTAVAKAGHLADALKLLDELDTGITARLDDDTPAGREEAMTFAANVIARARISPAGQVGIGDWVAGQEKAAKAREAVQPKSENVVPITALTGKKLTIFEVTGRDGFQSMSDRDIIPVRDKVNLVMDLWLAGVKHMEVGSFVNPKKVPQMANTPEVVEKLLKLNVPDDVRFSVLVPNVKGMRAALDAGIKPPNWEVSIFTSSTEAMEQANLGRSRADSMKEYEEMVGIAKEAGIPVRAYISGVCGCPITGTQVPPEEVIKATEAVLKLGGGYVYQVSLGDTTGVGHPTQVTGLLEKMRAAGIAANRLSWHGHDTWGTGVANVQAAIDAGIETVDAGVVGGGCIVVKGATGNVGALDVAHLAAVQGIDTGIDRDRLLEAAQKIHDRLRIEPESRVHKTMNAQRALKASRA